MYSIDASPCSATYIMSYLCSIFTARLANVLLSRLMGSSRSACGQTKKAIQPGIMYSCNYQRAGVSWLL